MPNLAARIFDEISGGRYVVGIGAGTTYELSDDVFGICETVNPAFEEAVSSASVSATVTYRTQCETVIACRSRRGTHHESVVNYRQVHHPRITINARQVTLVLLAMEPERSKEPDMTGVRTC